MIGASASPNSTTASNQLSIGNWIYGTNGNISIGTPTGTAKLTVAGTALITSDLTVQGKVISDTFVNRTVNNVTISGSILPDLAAPQIYRDIGNDTTQSWNNLYLSGQVKIKGGTPGAGKLLVSDANGLATWQTSTTSLSGTYWLLGGNSLAAATSIGSDNLQDFIVETNNTERMRVYSGMTSA